MSFNPEVTDQATVERAKRYRPNLGRLATKAAIMLSAFQFATATAPATVSAHDRPTAISATEARAHTRLFDTSMFAGWAFNIIHVGCGMTAASDVVSYVKQRFINPNQIATHSYPWYNNGPAKEGSDGHYMTGLGPQLARDYHIGFVQESLNDAAYDVSANGAAAMILAVAGPHDTFTDDAHYMAIEQSVGDKVKISDPNQPGHFENGKLWTIPGLEANGVFDTAWVFFPHKN